MRWGGGARFVPPKKTVAAPSHDAPTRGEARPLYPQAVGREEWASGRAGAKSNGDIAAACGRAPLPRPPPPVTAALCGLTMAGVGACEAERGEKGR